MEAGFSGFFFAQDKDSWLNIENYLLHLLKGVFQIDSKILSTEDMKSWLKKKKKKSPPKFPKCIRLENPVKMNAE